MSITTTKTALPKGLDVRILTRIIEEGYGPGAWHGPDLRAALADVDPEVAFWRPAPGRHSIAEIALHHAFYAYSVRKQLLSTPVEPFALEGEDWFTVPGKSNISWHEILRVVEVEQKELGAAVAGAAAGRGKPAVADSEWFDLVLGITCHAVYHAGQIQLIKKLRG